MSFQLHLIRFYYLQLAMKKSHQNDVFDSLQFPASRRPKLMPRKSLVENVDEDSIGRKTEDGENISKEKDVKISQDDDLFNQIRPIKMEPKCSDMGDEDYGEEEKNTSVLLNKGQRKPMSMLVVPSINIGHFSEGTQLTLPEPLRTTKQKEDDFEGKEADEEQVINAKDVLCYAWQIAKGMVRVRCLEHVDNICYLVVDIWVLKITSNKKDQISFNLCCLHGSR